MLDRAITVRLETQLEAPGVVVGAADEAALRRRPPSGTWSAHENLHEAHHLDAILLRTRGA